MYAQAIHEFQTKEIERIGTLIAGGLDSADLIGPRAANKLFKYRNVLRGKLLEILDQTARFGRGQVNAELKR